MSVSSPRGFTASKTLAASCLCGASTWVRWPERWKASSSAPFFERPSPRLLAAPPAAAPKNSFSFMTPPRRVVAECLGTAFLLAAVVGSGIMAEKLANGNIAIALLANTVATGATLTTLIFTFGPISGAHFNPALTLADASQGGISWSDAPAYVAAQVLG